VGRLGRNYSAERHSGHRSNPGRDTQQVPYKEGPSSTTPSQIASWCLAGIALLLILHLHLVPALLAGLLVYELVHVIAPLMQRNLSSDTARIVAVVILSTLIVGLLTAAGVGAVAFLRGDTGNLPMLLQKMAEILEGGRSTLPAWIMNHLPTNPEQLRETLARWLREHSPQLQLVGKETGRAIAQVLIGMIIGAMISLREALSMRSDKPLARALGERVIRLGDSFRQVVFAQVRISAVNTMFTGIYLVVVLPLFGVHLPFTKTLILITFLVGLLPVIGNLISNTVIVIVSLSHSLQIAIASLTFLIVIHKLEYFLNARIVGTQIKARPWELLIAMLVMEAAYGLPGVAAAPIYYAYVKRELVDRGLI